MHYDITIYVIIIIVTNETKYFECVFEFENIYTFKMHIYIHVSLFFVFVFLSYL